jgi:hypothetical protein
VRVFVLRASVAFPLLLAPHAAEQAVTTAGAMGAACRLPWDAVRIFRDPAPRLVPERAASV